MNNYIDIVFDGPPSHESGRFVEIEDCSGKSISFGKWVERDDGYWALRIPDHEAIKAARVKVLKEARDKIQLQVDQAPGEHREDKRYRTGLHDGVMIIDNFITDLETDILLNLL